MPKKSTAVRHKPGTSPSYYYKQYKALPHPLLKLTRKQFLAQADSTKSALLGTPVYTQINRVYAAATGLPKHRKEDIELVKHIHHKNGTTESRDIAMAGTTSHPGREAAIRAFHTPPERHVRLSDLRRLSFWQKVKFLFNALFRKGTK
jgi:hypothetical protein